jgi:hypothetical protein
LGAQGSGQQPAQGLSKPERRYPVHSEDVLEKYGSCIVTLADQVIGGHAPRSHPKKSGHPAMHINGRVTVVIAIDQ